MEMSQMYDEDLLENKFYQRFCDLCPTLFHSAVSNGWLICVPKVGTFETHDLTEQDCMSHVLIQVESANYKTASDKHVAIHKRKITLGEGFGEQQQTVHILFTETFYTDCKKKYQVCCIGKPLGFESSMPINTDSGGQMEFIVHNVDDASELLFSGRSNSSLRKQIDKLVRSQKTDLGCTDMNGLNLTHLRDKMHTLFANALSSASKDSSLKKRMQQSKYIASNLKISMETYIHHLLYKPLFKYVCTVTAAHDSELNKITRNLSHLQFRDLGVNTQFSVNLPRARKELLDLNKYDTPLTKMECVKKIIIALMQNPHSKQDIMPLTVDDLLPMLVFLIIKSPIPNWIANFQYMTEFHFSRSSLDEYSFYISTLEAALEYVRSGELNNMSTSTELTKRVDFSAVARSKSPEFSKSNAIDTLFELISVDDQDGIGELLNDDNEDEEPSAGMCHPLCSCDRCEKLQSDSKSPQSHVTVLSRNDRGFTALHQAAAFDRAVIIEYLKKKGGEIDGTDYQGATPLHVACQKGKQSAVMMLIYCGASVNAVDNVGNRPLHLASANGHEECVKALLYQSKPNSLDINAANENGETALHMAAKWSYEYMTKLLLDHGASPEARNHRKYTPMMMVSNDRIAKLLTEAIEKMQMQENSGFIEVEPCSPPTTDSTLRLVETSMLNERSEPILYSPKKDVSDSVKKFHRAVVDSDIEMIKHLMDWSDNVSEEIATDNDLELCHPLCQCSKCAPLQKSQASELNVNCADDQGRTALHLAVEKNDITITKLLLQKRADPNCKTDLIQFTPLHIACQQLVPNPKIVKMLLEYGAKVNSKDCNGRTPLHFSSQTGSVEISQILIEFKANLLATNNRGNTALHEAAKVNNVEIVKLLLEHNADPTLINKNGLTALQITSDSQIMSLLMRAAETCQQTSVQHKLPVCTTDEYSQANEIESESNGSKILEQGNPKPPLQKLLISTQPFNHQTTCDVEQDSNSNESVIEQPECDLYLNTNMNQFFTEVTDGAHDDVEDSNTESADEI